MSRRFIDLTGQKFCCRVALEPAPAPGGAKPPHCVYWRWRCSETGIEGVSPSYTLRHRVPLTCPHHRRASDAEYAELPKKMAQCDLKPGVVRCELELLSKCGASLWRVRCVSCQKETLRPARSLALGCATGCECRDAVEPRPPQKRQRHTHQPETSPAVPQHAMVPGARWGCFEILTVATGKFAPCSIRCVHCNSTFERTRKQLRENRAPVRCRNCKGSYMIVGLPMSVDEIERVFGVKRTTFFWRVGTRKMDPETAAFTRTGPSVPKRYRVA